jgi:hypothetical protein
VNHLYGRYGWRGLYQGFLATGIRNVPANALFFPVNEITKDLLLEKKGITEAQMSFADRCMCGSVAGLSYWLSVCPLDTIKTTVMQTPLSKYRAENLSYGKIVKTMWEEGGVPRFYQGVVPLAARAVPACGLMFASVDLLRHKLSQL